MTEPHGVPVLPPPPALPPLPPDPSDADIDAEPMLEFFAFSHLPERLRYVSAVFCSAAMMTVAMCPRNAERTVALRKLLESKDCAVRAVIARPRRPVPTSVPGSGTAVTK